MKKQTVFLFLAGLALLLCCGHSLHAQVITINAAQMTYAQPFNSLDTASTNSSNLPNGWSIFEYGTSSTTVNNQYKGNSGTSTTGDVFSYGSSGSSERALGSIGTSGNHQYYGAIFINNTGTTISGVHISFRGEQWRRGTCAKDSLVFRYSTVAQGIWDTAANKWSFFPGLTFCSVVGGNPTGTALDGNAVVNFLNVADTLPLSLSPGDSLLVSWNDRDVSGSDDGLAIDDLHFTFITESEPLPANIYLTGKYPVGAGVDPALNILQLHFDHPIEAGTGQLFLYRQGQSSPMAISVPGPQLSISDSTATLSGILLENDQRYYVLMTGNCFRKYGDTTPSLPITDTTYWSFSTADTVIPRPFTSLNESFQICADSTIGLFKPYSALGFKTWRCNNLGHGDTSCASMSGGNADGISDSNEDWLISSKSFDFSAMTKPELQFWHKLRYTGTVTRSIRISHDYEAGTHPNIASWTTLQVQDMTEEPTENWMPISDIDLSPYKHSPFFLAFTYSCGENGAYELSYDDILVAEEQLSIATPQAEPFSMQAIGGHRAGQIRFSISSPTLRNLSIRLADLSGKQCYQGKLIIQPGRHEYTINAGARAPGLYLLKAHDSQNAGIVKVILQ